MFDDVKIEWPEDTPEEATKSKKIRSVFTFPDLASVSPQRLSERPIEFVDGGDLEGTPVLGGSSRYSHSGSVRHKKHALGSLVIENPYSFTTKTYRRLFEGAQAALEERSGMAFEAHGMQRYAQLWPYFKQAVKQGALHYEPKARMSISRDLANIKTDEAIQLMPDAMLKLRAMRDRINDEPSVMTERVQRSAVRFWVARFKAEAECYKETQHADKFTSKQARAYIKQANQLCKKYKQEVRLPVVFMPEVHMAENPLQVAMVRTEAAVTAEPKSWEYVNGARTVSRVVYGYGSYAPRERGGLYCPQHPHNRIVSWLAERADHKATMVAFKQWLSEQESSDEA